MVSLVSNGALRLTFITKKANFVEGMAQIPINSLV
ncbi:hypothetical protein VIBR0546_14215 [Vibrio brasiliensis LMG 20546]|uniref:Uncharacterized protein n=1 Tax=Vibrio brasiliensis LMG 20546 TaxID=945543 RepID=E8LV62_9VIBR|nr:hypothetical protein VIBR0546_14215 [Vibrio brasiliensis LMG 20546]